jgi:hypothetical protein
MEGDVRHAGHFVTVLITDGEIDTVDSAEICDKAGDEEIVFGSYCALHVPSGGQGVFANAEAFLCGALQKFVAHDHAEGALVGQLADACGKGNNLAQASSALVAA